MDKYKELSLDQKIEQMKEDYNSEWWRPSKIDHYNLTNKVIFLFNCNLINLLVTKSRLSPIKKEILEVHPKS
jgi:hypothetical protein